MAVQAQPGLSGFAYVTVYVGAVTLSLPASTLLTLAGGLLFGAWIGGGLAILAATGGACLVFLLMRAALAPSLARRVGNRAEALRQALDQEGFLYLLSLRLLPLAPFWLVNLAAGLAGMRLAPYAAATLIGIMPGALVYAGVGAGLEAVLAQGEPPDFAALSSMRILLPLGGLALLSFGAALWRRRARILQAGSPAIE
ncbi:MAG TPA: VTT domain-containing protein [Roseomonas sp.]|nr:VTT domain-containing protein [Roseomonas sp.]